MKPAPYPKSALRALVPLMAGVVHTMALTPRPTPAPQTAAPQPSPTAHTETRGRFLTNEQRQAIRERLEAGERVKDVAEEFGISRAAVRVYCPTDYDPQPAPPKTWRRGPMPGTGCKFDEAEQRAIVARYERGETATDLVAEYDIAHSTMNEYIAKHAKTALCKRCKGTKPFDAFGRIRRGRGEARDQVCAVCRDKPAVPRLGKRSKACAACKQVLPLTAFPHVKRHARSTLCEACTATHKAGTPMGPVEGACHRLSLEQREQVRARLAAGEDAGLLAYEYGVSHASIKHHVAQLKRAQKAPKYVGEIGLTAHRVQALLLREPRADGRLCAHTELDLRGPVPRPGSASPRLEQCIKLFGGR
ncbi:hypothetical protein ADM96_15710 [Burkholderia sp. ST111]|nr:hypothetical protein ADM96_15710 [Burkholderia sp. ST111]